MNQQQEEPGRQQPLVPPTPVPLPLPLAPFPRAAKIGIMLWGCGVFPALALGIPLTDITWGSDRVISLAMILMLCLLHIGLAIGLAYRMRVIHWIVGTIAAILMVPLFFIWPGIPLMLFDADVPWGDWGKAAYCLCAFEYLFQISAAFFILNRKDVRAIYNPPKEPPDDLPWRYETTANTPLTRKKLP